MADGSPEDDREIRRRAAWLLGMLALVAGLFVTLMVTFFNSSGGDDGTPDVAGTSQPLTSSGAATGAPRSSPADRTASGSTSGTTSGSTSGTTSDSTSGSTGSSSPAVAASCPDSKPCALDGDVGSGLAAINDYRTKHGKTAVSGSVSDAARKCALSNGEDCSGGWAETQVPAVGGKPDGTTAVQKIVQYGKLLDDMKSIEVGWAYDPGSKQYFFAIVRND